MVPERGSVPLVIQDNPCHPLIHLIRFIFIEEDTEVSLKVSLLSILIIGLIEIPIQTLFCSQRLLIIDVSKIFSNASLK